MKNETNLTITFSELGIASDALAALDDHYSQLMRAMRAANCSTLIKDLQETQKHLYSLKRKVETAQNELLGDEFK